MITSQFFITGVPVLKKKRKAYTNYHISKLEEEFICNNYISRSRMIELGNLLNLTPKQIKVWFQNRRMKHKKKPEDTKTKDASQELLEELSKLIPL